MLSKSIFFNFFFYSSGLRIFYLENIMVMTLVNFFQKKIPLGSFCMLPPKLFLGHRVVKISISTKKDVGGKSQKWHFVDFDLPQIALVLLKSFGVNMVNM